MLRQANEAVLKKFLLLNIKEETMRIKKLFSGLLIGMMAFAPMAAIAEETATIRFILTADMPELTSDDGRGGYAKVATVAKIFKKQTKGNIRPLLIHAGDAYSPSLLSGLDKGKSTVDMLNAIGVDYMVLGNHEWDFGPEITRERVWQSNFTVLASNVIDKEGLPVDGTVRTAMEGVGPFRVGIMGLVTPNTKDVSNPQTDQFLPIMDTAKELAKELKVQGANLIVAIGHLDYVEDMELLQSGLVDVLLSGQDHYHIFFDNGKDVWIDSGEDGEKVGVLDVHMKSYIKRGEKRFSWEADMRYVDTKNIKEDTAIAFKVKSYEDLLGKELDVKIGETFSELDSRKKTVRTEEAAIGNLIIDAMREGVKAEIGLTNGGGIRAKKIYAPGTKITRRDILSELPFGNVVVKLELTGSQILEALENGVSEVERNSGRFPQVSGMSFTYNPKAKAGSRINSVKVGNSPLSKERTYTIATNDFLAKGGDGYSVFKKGKIIIDAYGAKLMASMVMDYIKAKGTVSPKVEGRIVAQ